MKEPTFSEIAAQTLCLKDPNLRVVDFARELRRLCDRLGMNDEDKAACLKRANLRPDAFKFDYAAKTVFAYEIEDTNPLTTRKLDAYIDLWWFLEYEYWDTRLFVLDRYGNNNREINLFENDCAIIRAGGRV